jgi:hypothetical protein
MRFIKRLVLNKKDPVSNTFAVEADGRIRTTTVRSLQLPSGTTTQRPSPEDGMVRYNTTLHDGEIYNVSGDGTGWERIKTNRQGQITPQNLGVGNYANTVFGPLSYDVDVAKPQNVMVFVDNVYQIPTTNYTLELGSDYVGRRYDAFFTGIGVQNIAQHKDQIEEKVNSIKGKLYSAVINFDPPGIFLDDKV